ncbi:MAG: integrase, partial [Gammaproteobacteria bacterium]|nr:integrase [Gammaproteobacteria bacterium]
MHGLRHAYAQDRYAEMTGWAAPTAGGPTSKALSRAEKVVDREARLTISCELGHEREQITAVYLGR